MQREPISFLYQKILIQIQTVKLKRRKQLTRGGFGLLLTRNSPKACGGCCILPAFSLFSGLLLYSHSPETSAKSEEKIINCLFCFFVHIRRVSRRRSHGAEVFTIERKSRALDGLAKEMMRNH